MCGSGYVEMTCPDCGDKRMVRKDSAKKQSGRCRSCCARVRGAKATRKTPAMNAACEHCCAAFHRRPSNPGKKYCSQRCRRSAKRADRIARTCATCGDDFIIYASALNTNASGVYCSTKCRNQGYRGQYRGSPTRGTPRGSWKRERAAFVEQHNDFCVWCGARDLPIEVHHLVGFRITRDNRPDNLVTLCLEYHVLFNRITEKMSGKPVKHQYLVALLMKSSLADQWHRHQGRAIAMGLI